MSNELIQYISRSTFPAVALFAFLLLIPKSVGLLRIVAFMLMFILFRDMMSVVGLWKISSTLELRFIDQPLTLWFLALTSVGLVVFSYFAIGPIGPWSKRPAVESILLGLSAGVLIALLPFVFGLLVQRTLTPKPDGAMLLVAIGALAFLGNLLEETIYRGHFQGYLYDLKLSPARVILLSGAAFAVCHSFLAFTVTQSGWPILAFTFYEGVICACLRHRNGLLAATLAHGMGLFLILSGILG